MLPRVDYMFYVYSVEPLAKKCRETFKIPAYPFKKGQYGPLPEETRMFFQDNGIIYYRDEICEYGIIIERNDGDDTPIADRSGYLAYKSGGLVGYRSLQILRWNSAKSPQKYAGLVEHHGDDLTWMHWNEPNTIRLMTTNQVRTS